MPELIVLEGRIATVPRPGPPRSCECGICQRCRERDRQRELRAGIDRNRICAAADCDEPFFAKPASKLYCTPKCRNREIQRRYNQTAKAKDYKQRWAEANPSKQTEYHARWYAKRGRKVRAEYKSDRVKNRAQTAAFHAIEDGTLVREPCEICGEQIVDAHHEDYSKPLKVRWLCRAHHSAVHSGQVVLSQSS